LTVISNLTTQYSHLTTDLKAKIPQPLLAEEFSIGTEIEGRFREQDALTTHPVFLAPVGVYLY